GRSEKRAERRGRTNDDARAAVGKRLRKANELNGVADALLGIEEKRLASQVLAVPAWNRQRRGLSPEFRQLEAPFVFAPPLFVLPGGKQSEGEVPVCLREFGRERERATIGFDRLAYARHRMK